MTATFAADRRTVSLWSIVAWLALGAATQAQQAVTSNETVRAQDGLPIHFTYYPALDSVGGQKRDVRTAAVLILLHGQEMSRLFWDKTSAPPAAATAKPGSAAGPFAAVLQQQGFAVISVDMRKHGDSVREGENRVTTNDYELMIADLIVLKEFVFQQHQAQKLNMRKLAIVAMDAMVPIAATFAEWDWRQAPYDDHAILAQCTPRGQDVRAIVMISPETNSGRVQATNSLRFLASPEKRMAFEVVVGKKDTAAAKKASTLFKVVRGASTDDERVKLAELDTNEKSAHLFGNPRIQAEVPIIKFLKANVADLSIDWQDRRSRLDRETP
jgi:pimeloyl-ACP methyl ester carboxylesterase